jgi:methionine-rich copper-binding protein CopC
MLFAAVVFAVLTSWSTSAVAHSELEASTPASGASVSKLEQFTLTFGEEIVPEFSKYTLVSASGGLVTLGAPTYDVTKTTVTVPVTGEIAAGTYAIGYAVLSIDGHPIAGKVAFTSTAVVPTPTPTPTPSPTPAPKPAVDTSAATKIAFGIVGLLVPAAIVAVVLIRRRLDARNAKG